VLLRQVSRLEAEGGDLFFGEPEMEIADLIRTAPDGRGIVSVLDVSDMGERPALFSTFLMWVLAELFDELPEVGDPEKPALVFFFDEAHLLFDDASDAFLEAVARTVRLIRSKGVGVFFITQLPTDLPDEVLAQLGHRVQHAVRAFTPKDARALKQAVETFPATQHYDLAETLQALGVGEAAVTALDPRGVPTPVAATRLYPPASRMGPLTPEERAAAIAASPLRSRYAERIDRESAAELLEARMAGDEAKAEEVRERAKPAPRQRSEPPPEDTSLAGEVQDMLDSSLGRTVVREVIRGIFGGRRRGR
jgi:DNA helicase HerA-like ATPase